ncbi:MAG: glycosyltransferase family A protein [Candidatus Ventricola sp.]
MTYQLLVATMNQTDHTLCERMNLRADAIIVNQCDRNGAEEFRHGGFDVRMLSFRERGVGLSRNSALMRADADIVEFADDDMIFTDTCREDVLREFTRHPEADAILFSVESLNPDRPLLKIGRFERVSRWSALKYGCARLAVRREKLIYNNISFSLLFGGGAKYGSGEDTLFLQDCIRAGLRVYRSPVKVADIRQEASSWFEGYTDSYFFDKGALFAAALPWGCGMYALLTAVKLRRPFRETVHILRQINRGIREFKRRQRGRSGAEGAQKP